MAKSRELSTAHRGAISTALKRYWRSAKAAARKAKTKTVLHVVPKRARDVYAGAILWSKAHHRISKTGTMPAHRAAKMKTKALQWAKGNRPENKHHYSDDYRSRRRK